MRVIHVFALALVLLPSIVTADSFAVFPSSFMAPVVELDDDSPCD